MPSQVDKSASGLVVVDHGSREEAANKAFEVLTRSTLDDGAWRRVEPAHMELAEPTIATAVRLCVDACVDTIVVSPFFLLPGRHWQEDIPRMAREALAGTDVALLVTSPIGLDPAIAKAVSATIDHCLAQVGGAKEACEACELSGLTGCHIERPGNP